ncbi:maltose ABC transporter substrate-binding protein [Bacillus sp. 03113]|uniref:sugar ABC transporter substrate-binding protein n=1 Tax=Bacillus sp. 03113 TaxID=2578211 RepID=UPI0011421828|nr:maltose ABC transporter substrate-binding protein [Bacillus sp. 03113]
MKKILKMLTITMMLLLLLVACNKPNSSDQSGTKTNDGKDTATSTELKPEPGAELLFWTMKDPLVEAAVKEFEEKYNIKVKVEEVQTWDTADRVKTDGPAGIAADVIGMVSDNLGTTVNSGVLLPNDYFEKETRKNSNKIALDASSYKGVLYGYPRDIYTYALYVNKDLVKDAKFETWDDVKTFAKQYNNPSENKFGFMYDAKSWYFNSAFILGYDGYIFGKNGTDINDIGINSAGAVKGMEFYHSLKDILPLKLQDISNDVRLHLWEQGKLAINMDATWNLGNNKKMPFEVEVLPMPKMPGDKSPIALVGSTGYYVTSYTKYPNASRIFANYLTSKDMLGKLYESTGRIPALNGFENEEKFKDDQMLQGFLAQIKNGAALPNVPEMSNYWKSLESATQNIWNNDADIKKTLDKAAEDMKSGIKTSKD